MHITKTANAMKQAIRPKINNSCDILRIAKERPFPTCIWNQELQDTFRLGYSDANAFRVYHLGHAGGMSKLGGMHGAGCAAQVASIETTTHTGECETTE